MKKIDETLNDILKNASGIFNLNNFYSHDMQYWEDENKIPLSVSPVCEKITGYSSEEFLGNPKLFESIIFKEDLSKWEERCQLVHIDDVAGIQIRLKHKSGKIIWIEHDAQKLFNSSGKFIGIRSSNREITNHKLSEEIIRESSSILFLWKNIEGYPVEFVSSNVENILGYNFEEFLSGKISYSDLLHPECVERVTTGIKQNIRVGKTYFKSKPYRVITKTGKTIWVSDSTTAKRDLDGSITHFHGIVTDITEQKEAEEAHRKSEVRLAFSQEAAKIGSWELDLVTDEFYWSEQIELLLGFSEEELKKKKTFRWFLRKVHKKDRKRLVSTLNKGLKQDSFFEIEYRVVWDDGTIHWVLGQGKVLRNKAQKAVKVVGSIRDVTDRVLLFDKLKKSEKQFKSLVESSPYGIVIHSDGKVLYTNSMAIAIVGGSASKSYVGTDIKKFIHHESMEKVSKKMKVASKGLGKRVFFNIKGKRLNGTSFNVAIANTKIKYKGKSAIQTVFYDITKDKKVQDELRRSEEVYRNVFTHSPLGIFHFDVNGIITDCNDKFSKLLKIKKEDLLGFPMLSKLENESIKEVIRDSLINGSSYYEGDYRVIQTGKIISIIVRLNAVYTDDNIVSGGVGLVEDVSERKKNESIQKALFDISEEVSRKTSINNLYRKFHEIIKTLMSADNMYVAMHNRETNLITFPYYVDQYDTNPETLEFKNGLTEYILRTKKSQVITEAMDKALQAKGEVDLTGESSKVWVGIYLEFEGVYSGVLALQDYENENAYSEKDLKILQFVSRQIVKVLDMQYANRRLNESFNELSVAKKELEIINKNKDRFFSIIAHDLRSPFNTLLGISEMISGDMDEMSMREVKEISSVIHSSTQNLFKLIENLLSWSRLQMGSFYIEPKEIKVRDIANSVLEILDITANEKEVLIQNNIKNMKAFADKECVKTVFRNLVSNAIKFTKRSEGIINLTSKELPEFIEITIADNGVGIKSSIVKNLFSINEKTSYAGTENESGTGLGLILCKDLIEKNNGEIWVESKYGKGSRFTFTLPKTTSN